MRRPPGLNATLITKLVPVIGWPTGWPVSTSHSRAKVSMLSEAMRLPSGG